MTGSNPARRARSIALAEARFKAAAAPTKSGSPEVRVATLALGADGDLVGSSIRISGQVGETPNLLEPHGVGGAGVAAGALGFGARWTWVAVFQAVRTSRLPL